jgi:hypothetical protein
MQKINKTKMRTTKAIGAKGRAESRCPSSGTAFGIAKVFSLVVLLIVTTTASWAQVVSPNAGSVPSGTATNEVLRLAH